MTPRDRIALGVSAAVVFVGIAFAAGLRSRYASAEKLAEEERARESSQRQEETIKAIQNAPPPTMAEAFRASRPAPIFDDVMDAGTARFVVWAARSLKWSDVEVSNALQLPEIVKDPLAAQGIVKCFAGVVAQIEANRTHGALSFDGVLATHENEPIRFAAVHSTEGVGNGSRERICGIVTGATNYSTTKGERLRAVHLVGIFDLPKNR